MKGVELPINILVIVAIAVIVLLGLVALYFIGFNPFSTTTALDSTKNSGCRVWMNANPACGSWPTDGSGGFAAINVTWQGVSKYFSEFMVDDYKCADAACARRACSCPGY